MAANPSDAQSAETADMRAPAEAHRGDLIVYQVDRRDWINGAGVQERTTFEVGEVAGITRDRRVRTVRTYGGGEPRQLDRIIGYQRCWLADKNTVDVPAACEAAWANPWHQGSPGKPFDTLDEVLAIVRPFKRTTPTK